MTKHKAVITIENLAHSYNGQTVLEDVDLRVTPGDFVAMIGPNGGGKTTLLKLMVGLLKPSRGKLLVFDAPPHKSSHRIGYVPQNVHINRHFPISVMDVVLMGKLRPGRGWVRHSQADKREARQALDRLELDISYDRRIGALSGGQLQRLFIARALVTAPELLLLDEPAASIDTRGQSTLYRLLKQLNKTITIVVVSHDLIALSRYVKSVACVNRRLHYHDQSEVTGEMLETMYPCPDGEICPVELVAHGLPHRVLREHKAP